MSVDSYIDAYYKEPSCTVRFNGNRSRDILSVEISQSMDNLTSATIKLLSNPSITPETKVQIKQGYNGQEVSTFTGFIDTIERQNGDRAYNVQARDMLKKALDTFLVQEVKFGIDVALQQFYYSTYDSADGGTFVVHQYDSLDALHANHPETNGNITNQGAKAEAVVQWLLHMSGLAEGSEIQVDDTNFWIGDITPAKFHLTSVYDAAMQIANLIGWRIFCDPTGVCRFKKRPRNPSSFYPSWTYKDTEEPYNIHHLNRNESSVDLRTYVEVRGASGIRYVARGTSPYLGTVPYRGVLISDELIDTPGIAKFVGDRILGDLNRLKVTIVLESDGNPKLVPGSTVTVKSVVCTGNYLVESVQTTMSSEAGYKSSINAAAYFGDTKFEEPPLDIEAVFTALQVIGIGDPSYMVELDGSASFSSVGPITRYVWTMPDSSVQDSSDPDIWYTFPDYTITGGNSAIVTLQVYDGLGNTDILSSGITLEGLQSQASIKYRQLYGALTDIGVGTVDGGLTWNTSTIPAISVAASNFAISGAFTPSGYALFGTSDSKIYKTIDAAKTVYEVFNAGSPVLDINIPELDSSFAAAGTENGKVYRSIDAGESWTQIGDFAFPILQVKYSFTDFTDITILGSGNDNMYFTNDAGGSWSKIPTGVNGLWMTDSNVKNYVAHTAGILNMSDSANLPGSTNIFPAATYAVNVDDNIIVGAGIMAVDNTGQHFIYASGLSSTQYNPDNRTKHMIRDGEVPFLVYYAVASGIGKSLDKNVTMSGLYYPVGSTPTNGWGKKVAYGPLASPVIPARLVWRGTNGGFAGSSEDDGFAYNSIGTSGWVFIPGSNFGGDFNTQFATTTPGYIAIGKDSRIHYISVPVDGLPQSHQNHAALVDTPATNHTPSNLGIYFSRKIVTSGELPRLFALAGGGSLVPDLQVFNDFFLNPTNIDHVTGLNDPVYKYHPHYAIPKNKDHVLISTQPLVFVGSNAWYLYNVDTMVSTEISEPLTQYGHPDLYSAPTTDWLTIAYEETYVDWVLLDVFNGTLTPINLGNKDVGQQIFESSIVGSDLYFSVPDNVLYHSVTGLDTTQGIFKVSGYGTGTPELLLEIPLDHKIVSFRVTHDVLETKDYLVVVSEPRSSGQVLVYYSTDAGVTWLNTQPLNAGTNTLDCWYIDTR